MNSKPTKNKKEVIATLAVLIVIVVIVATAAVANKKKPNNMADTMATSETGTSGTDTAMDTPSNASDTSSDSTPSSSSASTYADGTYSAMGTYSSPGGNEGITVSLTLKGDVVTATSAKGKAGDSEAEYYQDQFISSYKQYVVGKNIDNLSLSRVAGSSLTSQGFNSAIKNIKAQARS